MNFSDQTYLALGITLGLLNWVLRNHGGFARGWAGAIFVGICWAAGLAIIVVKTFGG